MNERRTLIIHVAHHLLHFACNVADNNLCVICTPSHVASNCRKQTIWIHLVINIFCIKPSASLDVATEHLITVICPV